MPKPLACPICKKPVDLSSAEVPFCSPRCRTIDLGKWASGDYKISSPIFSEELQDPGVLEDLEHAEQQRKPVRDAGDILDGPDTGRRFWKN